MASIGSGSRSPMTPRATCDGGESLAKVGRGGLSPLSQRTAFDRSTGGLCSTEIIHARMVSTTNQGSSLWCETDPVVPSMELGRCRSVGQGIAMDSRDRRSVSLRDFDDNRPAAGPPSTRNIQTGAFSPVPHRAHDDHRDSLHSQVGGFNFNASYHHRDARARVPSEWHDSGTKSETGPLVTSGRLYSPRSRSPPHDHRSSGPIEPRCNPIL
jgi:hypothetical protein